MADKLVSYFHLGKEAETESPALLVRVCDAPGVFGGTAVMLCDAQGQPLPDQEDCQIDSPNTGAIGKVTASFLLGRNVRLSA